MTERGNLMGDAGALDDGDRDTPGEEDEDLFPAWFDDWTEPPPPPRVPWYRNTRVLGAAMGVAVVALVVSTALLLTLNSPADFPTGPRISNVTTPAPPTAASAPPRSRTELSASPRSSEPSPASETESPEPPSAEPAAPPAAPPPPPRVQAGDTAEPEGPRINVTRAPMSFTPTSVPKR